jgi:short subunit dehydrogenase-like uncharacterized protein
MPIARACATAGIAYLDITGETQFTYNMINELDYLATKTHAVLIPGCGFDSVPSDVIAFLSARTLTQSLPQDLLASPSDADVGVKESHTMFRLVYAGPSGGTLASSISILGAPRKFLDYPDILSPVPAPRDHQKMVYSFPKAARSNAVGSPYLLAVANIPIVQRTRGLFTLQALKGDSRDANEGEVAPVYARNYSYSESAVSSNRITAFLFGITFVLGNAALLLFPPLRWLIARIGFKSGEGPSDE